MEVSTYRHLGVCVYHVTYRHCCSLFLFEDFGASGEHVEIVESEEFVGDPAFGTATTQIHKV